LFGDAEKARAALAGIAERSSPDYMLLREAILHASLHRAPLAPCTQAGTFRFPMVKNSFSCRYILMAAWQGYSWSHA
jgi:hypothetical protein